MLFCLTRLYSTKLAVLCAENTLISQCCQEHALACPVLVGRIKGRAALTGRLLVDTFSVKLKSSSNSYLSARLRVSQLFVSSVSPQVTSDTPVPQFNYPQTSGINNQETV